MESLKDLLLFLHEVRWSLEGGYSLSYSLKRVAGSEGGDFASKILWLLKEEEASSAEQEFPFEVTPEERACLGLFSRGLQGEVIAASLEALSAELEVKIIHSVDMRVKRMPFLSLIPIFLFQWPALLLLFLWPIIKLLLKEVQ